MMVLDEKITIHPEGNINRGTRGKVTIAVGFILLTMDIIFYFHHFSRDFGGGLTD